MSADARDSIVQTRFYSLAEAGVIVGMSPGDLLRLGSNVLLSLCVLVPGGRRAFTVDPGSIVIWNSRVAVERHIQRAEPSKEKGEPERKDDVVALVLNWSQCQEVEDYGVSRQILFDFAYAIGNSERRFGYAPDPMRIRPVRMPLYERDGRTPADQSRWRFAIYSCATPLMYIDQVGYPEPEDLLVTLDAIRILGRELMRLPKPIDLAPEDVEVEFADHDDEPVDYETVDAQDVVIVEESVPDFTATVDEFPAAEVAVTPSAVGSESQASVELKAAESPEPHDSIVLLPRGKLEKKIGKGRNWIYERINKKHKRYDPTFPLPIEIGGGLGWIESEVDEWLRRQVEKGRRR